MLKYGSDKPDLAQSTCHRRPHEEFNDPSVTHSRLQECHQGGWSWMRAVPAPASAAQPRSFSTRLNDWARQRHGAPRLGYVVFEARRRQKARSPSSSLPDVQARIDGKAGIKAWRCRVLRRRQACRRRQARGEPRGTRIRRGSRLIAKDRFELLLDRRFPDV